MEALFLNTQRVDNNRFLRTICYGEGVFETFRYKGKMPAFIDRHFERLSSGLKLLNIPLISKDDFLYNISKAIENFDEKDLYVKLVVFGEGMGYYPLYSSKANILVVVKPYKPVEEDISLTVSPIRVHSSDPLLKIKSTNYLRNILVKRLARENGYFDGIVLNENEEITETSSANIYWIKGKYLYTPDIGCGVLPGISRSVVLRKAKEEGFIVVEGRFGLKDIKNADYTFISNALHGILRVGKLDV